MNDPHANTPAPITQETQPQQLIGAIAAGAGVLQFLVQAAEATFWARLVPLVVMLWDFMPLFLMAGGFIWYLIQRRRENQLAQVARLRDHDTRLAALEALASKRCTVAARRKLK